MGVNLYSTGLSVTHTPAVLQRPFPSTCCSPIVISPLTFHSILLIRAYQLICCTTLSRLDYLLRALWHTRHKQLWKPARFPHIQPGRPIILQGSYILMTGAISDFIFPMSEHMLAYSLRKASTGTYTQIYICIYIYLFSLKGHCWQLPREQGWQWSGRSRWLHATNSRHVQSTAGRVRRFVLRAINQLSPGCRATICPLRAAQWSNASERQPWRRERKITVNCMSSESFANRSAWELKICTTKRDLVHQAKNTHAALQLLLSQPSLSNNFSL